MDWALDLIEEHVKSIYKVDILSAVKMIKNIWRGLEPKRIENCWLYKNIEGGRTAVFLSSASKVLQNEECLFQSAMSTLIDPDARISISMLANRRGEEEHCQVVSDTKLLDQKVSEEECEN